jgi:starch synthase
MAKQPLNILFLAAEAVPFAKVGGLADVAGALPKALRALGHDVRIMIPRYGTIRSDEFHTTKIGEPFRIRLGPDEELVHLANTITEDDVPVYLVYNKQYFYSRDGVYGFDDDAQRFAAFGRASLAALKLLEEKEAWKPQVIHANDWHTALIPAWLNTDGQQDPFYCDIASLFTIHNLTYQGIAGRLLLTFARMENMQHLSVEEPGTVNWMAQAIAHADLVNTVSKQYAKEILTSEIGAGLDDLLKQRKSRLFGVQNGIDYEQWNPATDPHISHHFSVDTLDQRAINKTALQQQARLPVQPDIPLVGMVTRLDSVKGLDLMEPVLEWLMEEERAQFVLLGTGAPEYHEMFGEMQARFRDRMHAFLKFDAALAQRIYAGADMFLMPSHIEPCGLGQMIAMRYGCVPIVRATGGLADTVSNYTTKNRRGTGFTFSTYTSKSCMRALKRALNAYQNTNIWRGLQRRGMQTDFSWSASAQEYVKLYRKAIKLHGV